MLLLNENETKVIPFSLLVLKSSVIHIYLLHCLYVHMIII